ncbi:MAG: hypothetical protein J5790_04680 [Bacteroidaceae bacterium]|nr:hypothetical protein [Bacteroidaceae bacterium]
MANFSLEISAAVSTAWEYAKKYGLLIAVIYLLVGVVSGGLHSIVGPSMALGDQQAITEAIGRGDWESIGKMAQAYNTGIGSNISTMFSGIITTIVSVGLYNLALGLMSGRFSEVTFDAFKLPFATYLKVFVVSFITGLICVVACFFCIIPVFFVAPRLILAPVYQVEHPEAGIGESISAAWKMTSDNTMSMLGLGIVMVGIIILGFCCCCIGMYFAQAIELFALIAAYNQLKGNLQ